MSVARVNILLSAVREVKPPPVKPFFAGGRLDLFGANFLRFCTRCGVSKLTMLMCDIDYIDLEWPNKVLLLSPGRGILTYHQ